MKNKRLTRFFNGLRQQESGAHLAIGAMLVMSILYATTMI